MSKESLAYFNKVFSDNHAQSCPIVTNVVLNSSNSVQQLTFLDECQSCGCGCGCCSGCASIPDDDATFSIEKTEVFINDFDLVNPCDLTPLKVRVNGIPVDRIDNFNERYLAGTADLMSQISDCEKNEKGLPTRASLLIHCIGPWAAKITVVVFGSMFSCGVCKRFKLCMTTKNSVIVFNDTSTFLVSSLALPCVVSGIAPIINISFGAIGEIVCTELSSEKCASPCTLELRGTLIAEPTAEVEVTRQTLFRTNAEVVNIPCDDLQRCHECSGQCEEHHCRCMEDECDSNDKDDDCNNHDSCNIQKTLCCQYNGFNGCSF